MLLIDYTGEEKYAVSKYLELPNSLDFDELDEKMQKILSYLPEDDENGRIRSLCADLEFNHSLDCRGAAADMQLFAEAVPESFDATLINGRRLNLRCVLGISVKVVRPMLLSLTTGVENADDIALKKERFRFISDTDGCECQIILRDQLALPAGKPAFKLPAKGAAHSPRPCRAYSTRSTRRAASLFPSFW